MKPKSASTRTDVIVVLVCIFFLVINLGAAGLSGRERAKEVVCLSNLCKWAAIFEVYTGENDGKFYQYGLTGGGGARWWISPCDQYLRSGRLGCCPMATKHTSEGGNRPYALAFRKKSAYSDTEYVMGSYCPNGWLITLPTAYPWPGQGTPAQHWGGLNVAGAGNIPLFTDSQYHDAWPRDTDEPPQYEGYVNFSYNHITRVTAARHNGGQNMLFADFSGRKIGLKELWTLKWSRPFHTDGPWTIAGGVQPEDWPEWMRNFKDF